MLQMKKAQTNSKFLGKDPSEGESKTTFLHVLFLYLWLGIDILRTSANATPDLAVIT